MNAVRVLLIDGSDRILAGLDPAALQGGVRIVTERAQTMQEIRDLLGWFEPDLILSEHAPPELDGMQALQLVRSLSPDVPFVFCSDTRGSHELEALRQGALDYVPRSDPVRLLAAVRHALNEGFERRARHAAERALQESEIRFRLLIEHLPGAVSLKDLDGRFTYVNSKAERMIGLPADQILGRTLIEAYAPEVAAAQAESDRHALSVRQPVESVERGITADGPRTYLSVKFPIDGLDRLPVMVGAFSMDVTQRAVELRRTARLHRTHAMLSGISNVIVRGLGRDALLADACRLAVETGGFRMAWIGLAEPGHHKVTPVACHGADDGYLDEVGRMLAQTTEERHLTGWSVHVGTWDAGVAAEAARASEVIVCEDIASDARVVFKESALSRGFHSLVALPLKVHDVTLGTMTLFGAVARTYDSEEVDLLRILAENIALALDRITKAHQLDYVSWYDPLTALPNRALFVDRLARLLSTGLKPAQGVTVLLVDLTRFREVNAQLGRKGADQALSIFAHRLTAAFGQGCIIGRIGGDQFAVATTEFKLSVLASLGGDRWDGALGAPMVIDGVEIRTPFKIGISSTESVEPKVERLLLHAEAALLRAKQLDEPYSFYSPALNSLANERLQTAARLREAVGAKQFVLHYQVKVDLMTGHPIGAEALLRWNDPVRGLVAPHDFLGLLEESGLIVDVGRWAIQQAVADLRWWHACNLMIPRVSVNVSWVQLRRPDFVGQVLAAAGGPVDAAAMLDLEITEDRGGEDMTTATAQLQQLHELGVGIVMDDFGTGRSSLRRLTEWPIDVVKIDRSLVVGLMESPGQIAVASAIVGLARSLGIASLAEGIETEAVCSQLRLMGCQQGQGLRFGKPMPARELLNSLCTPVPHSC